jgi:hypothetical protein
MVLGLKRRLEKTIIKYASEAEGKQEPMTRGRTNQQSCAIKEGARRKKAKTKTKSKGTRETVLGQGQGQDHGQGQGQGHGQGQGLHHQPNKERR